MTADVTLPTIRRAVWFDEGDRHRGMVGERPAIENVGASGRTQPAPEYVVDVAAAGVDEPREPHGAQVQVAADDYQRRLARPPQGRLTGEADVRRRPVGAVDGRVEVRHPGAAREPDGMHHAPLGEDPQSADPMLLDGAADQDCVASTTVRLDEVGPAIGNETAHGQAEVARGQCRSVNRRRCSRQLRRPPRRHFLQQRDVPLPAGQRCGEFIQERAARAGLGPPVKEVPGEHAHSRILSDLTRHFLTGTEIDADELLALVERALELKAAPRSSRVLEERTVALIFEKPSTRTRVSFESGVVELGGHPMLLRAGDLQLTRGESVRDTAMVLSRHVAAIGLRTGPDELLEELALHATVPVVNMLTARHHPCQALADLVTLREAFGALGGLRVAYVGDGNNVARSLALLGARAGVEVVVASPAGYELEPVAGAQLVGDPAEAVRGANALYTDVWVSMGDEASADERRAALGPYRIDDALLDRAAPDAIALHCLPAHPGEEITADVLYGRRQRIWDQAENRRHAQKALLELLVEP